jgi:hypothetical protein
VVVVLLLSVAVRPVGCWSAYFGCRLTGGPVRHWGDRYLVGEGYPLRAGIDSVS